MPHVSCCGRDLWDQEAEYTAMAARIPHASGHLFRSGGHPAVLSRAEEAARAVLTFLTEGDWTENARIPGRSGRDATMGGLVLLMR